MNELVITPDFDKKSAKIRGRCAAGEHVLVRLVGGAALSTGTLRLCVMLRERLFAVFPVASGDDDAVEWSVDGEDLTCVLNLNTEPLVKFARCGALTLEFILDDPSNHVLYFSAMHEVLPWHSLRTRGDDAKPRDIQPFDGVVISTKTLTQLREAVKRLAEKGGAQVIGSIALALLAVRGVFAATVTTAPLNDLEFDTNPQVVTNVTFEGLSESSNVYTKAETEAKIVELAPAPGNYSVVSNRAMNAVQTETDPVWNVEKSGYATKADLTNKADATVAVQKQWNGPHLPEVCFPVVFYQGTTRREIRSPSELSWVRDDDLGEIDMYCDDTTGEYSEGLFYIATFLNVRREGTYYYSMFGNVAIIEIDGETVPLLWFNGREPVSDNENGFPALVNPGIETNHYGVVYSNAFSSAVTDLRHTLADKTKAAEQSLADAKETLGESIDRKADKVIIEYAYGANTNSYWVADWNGERLDTLYGDGVDDGSIRWGGETISLEWDAELQSDLGYGWTLEVGYDREYGSEFTATASGTATSGTLEFSNFTLTRHWLREQTPVSTNVVQYVIWGVDTTDGRYYIDFEE